MRPSSTSRTAVTPGTILLFILILSLTLAGCGGKKAPTPVPTSPNVTVIPLTPTSHVPKYLPTHPPTAESTALPQGSTVTTISGPPTPVLPKVEVVVNQIIGYNGPGEQYTPVGSAGAGEQLIVEERSPDGQWLHVCCFAGRPGWVALKDVRPLGSLDDVPVAESIPTLSPLPTPTSTEP
ncbi:MAG: SH3 domain-containing protein [Chloroflexi bacterium]|nr:SH3 domain-containing protein [Chloroflexota bacterium]